MKTDENEYQYGRLESLREPHAASHMMAAVDAWTISLFQYTWSRFSLERVAKREACDSVWWQTATFAV